MINIAICDDDVAITATIEEILYKIAKEQGIKISCSVFFDGFTLVEDIRQGTYYDLIYLDIEMRKVNGISAAELIRGMEIPALIVYVSSYEKSNQRKKYIIIQYSIKMTQKHKERS